MTLRLSSLGVRHVLLDIEGTTTPIAFVHDLLFPYARAGLRRFLTEHGSRPDIQPILERLRGEYQQDRAGTDPPPALAGDPAPSPVTIAPYLEWLMDRDRKSTGLKALQGLIWERGFETGELKGEVFPDVAPALASWRASGIGVSIFSSGSALAQRLLFSHSIEGDLTPSIERYFDTTTGQKIFPDSYRAIAVHLGCKASAMLFVSDVVAELNAAQQAELRTVLCVRPGNVPQPAQTHETIHSFSEIVP